MEDLISEEEREKPEIILPVLVYIHADKEYEPEVRERIQQVRHVIEEALGDEDNDLVTFVYPEVKLERPRGLPSYVEV